MPNDHKKGEERTPTASVASASPTADGVTLSVRVAVLEVRDFGDG